ncbi:transferrin-binding protein-like solute binding protein [Pseudosulfitobacter koreensis]|uniref:Transferrin-binding protein-like solute binding protein n=1 Tax=Pseudosulfitobacter koreensis TaxID=2968472 RepID=A0ABT1Z4C9_9RHOB|nr:transferrin-binding protein-like solute binding protein [Pseudosulfitobacter koreense]MCR8827985.1 transferrin-binding protein-like solute binding protein [Pseudosulfitobacter koreense]
MTRLFSGIAVLALVAACGDGNPFTAPPTDTGGDPTTGPIPAVLASDLDSFTYDPTTGTLVVTGVSLDEDALGSVYRRTPGLDVPGYVAFTAQDDALDQHATAYVQDINGTRAGIMVTGGQFGTYNGGAAYGREGGYSPHVVTGESGLVTYEGDYVGLTNLPGDETDLLPFPDGRNEALRPGQAAKVTGKIFFNVDFSDNTLKGSIYERQLDLADSQLTGGATTVAVANIDFVPTTIDGNGTFQGDARIGQDDKGTYGGIFGGTESEVMAGAVFLEDHLLEIENAEEYGVWVLGKCGGPQAGAPCTDVDD